MAGVKQVVARTRPLPLRKQVLYSHHQHLVASSPLVLFLRPTDFSAHEWRHIRAQLAQLPPDGDHPAPTLTVLRPGLLPALLRDPTSPLATKQIDTAHLATPSHLAGPLAALTAPSLHPPTLARILALLSAVSRAPKRNAPPPPAGPGAPPPPERLALLSSLVDHTAADPARTAHIAQLPPLDVLRAQIVGLLAAPGSRVAAVIGARAGSVARTLEGFKAGLEQAARGAQDQASA